VGELPSRVPCGALAAAMGDGASVQARVWPPGAEHLAGHLAHLIDVRPV
jgi:hypothetical protein